MELHIEILMIYLMEFDWGDILELYLDLRLDLNLDSLYVLYMETFILVFMEN